MFTLLGGEGKGDLTSVSKFVLQKKNKSKKKKKIFFFFFGGGRG